MSKFSLLARSVLGTGAVAVVLSGCGAPHSGFGALPQSVPGFSGVALQHDVSIQPDVASACPRVGKTYTTGKGHAKAKFQAVTAATGLRKYFWEIRLDFYNWPRKKSLPDWTMQLFTCGPQAGKKPIGKILTFNDVRSGKVVDGVSPLGGGSGGVCIDGICHYWYDWSTDYQSPEKLPNGKSWKYDEAVFKFKTSEKGWGALPAQRIEVVK